MRCEKNQTITMKRKPEDPKEISIESFDQDLNVVVGSFFNGMSISSDTGFNLYKHKTESRYELHGENEVLEYIASTNDDDEANSYCIGVYDDQTQSVRLYQAPLVNGRVVAKSKRRYNGPKIKQMGIRNNLQRNTLGEAFGTKRAKSSISNLERNRIDSDKLQSIELDVVDSIKSSTSELPTKQQMEQQITDVRPIPPINLEATSAEDIYSITSIIPKADWTTLRVGAIIQEEPDKRLELLPFSKSPFLQKHIETNDETKLKLLYYLSILFGIYQNRKVKDKFQLTTKFNHQLSDSIINNLLDTFTISKATRFGKSKDKSFVIDPQSEDKLLCYVIALIFHIDNFLIEIQPLSYELNLKPTKLINLLRIMGAIVKPPTQGQAEALGISKSSLSNSKLAILKAPVKLPDMSRRIRRS